MAVKLNSLHFSLVLSDDPFYLLNALDGNVEFTELMGAEIYLYLNVGEETNLVSRVSSQSTAKAGDVIKVAVDTSRIHIFDKETEKIICH